MPDFTTHYLLGQRVLAQLPEPIRHIIKMNSSSFNYGCQGPDLLFFSKVITGKCPLPMMGSVMHRHKNTQLFYEMGKFIEERRGKRDYHILLSYFFGFLCHYYADSNCHPYVYYHQNRLGGDLPRRIQSAIHCRIESDIDTLLYPYYTNLEINQFQPERYYQSSDSMRRSVAALYGQVFCRVYDTEISQRAVYQCFINMIRLNRLFYRPSVLGLTAAKVVDAATRSPDLLASHFKGGKPDWPVLNLPRHKWYDLWEPEIPRSESFPQLLDIALGQAVQAIIMYNDMIENKRVEPIEYTKCFSQGDGEG